MTIDDEKEMKNYNMILIEKQEKYWHYHQVKVKYKYLENTNILQVKTYYLLIKAE